MARFLPIFIVALVLVGASASTAHAGRGIIFVNTGSDYTHVSDIKSEHLAEIQEFTGAQDVAIGMVYDRFGIFWLDIVRWDSKFVLYSDSKETFWEADKADLESVAAGSLSKPFTVTVPPGLIIILLLIAGVVAFVIYDRATGGGATGESSSETLASETPGQPTRAGSEA